MTEHDRPEIPVSVAEPIFTRRKLILDIDLSQNSELRPALSQLIARDGWALRFFARDMETDEQFIIQFVGGHDV